MSRLASLLGVMAVVAACGSSPIATPSSSPTPLLLKTESPGDEQGICMQALFEPVRVAHSDGRVTFVSVMRDVETTDLVWPHTLSARMDRGVAVIVGNDGAVLAREGDVLSDVAGGWEPGVGFRVCWRGYW